jgi:4-hydroxy-tetrahydrodipicolinate synthase
MAEYRKSEAREWARAKMRGVANVITPTFTQDLRGVNERAIRHDVRKEIEYGFWGALMVAETATTPSEYSQCMTWAVDEAKGKLHLIHHASISTLRRLAPEQRPEPPPSS